MSDYNDFIFDNIQEGVILLEKNGTVLYYNQAAARLLIIRPGKEDSCVGKSINDLGTILPFNIWQSNVSKKEIIFRKNSYEINLIFNAEVKNDKIILCFEKKNRENVKCIKPDDLFSETLETMVGIPREIRDKAYLLAKEDIPILMQGESGTGKELLAKAIHLASHRNNGPFVVVDCSALPATLIETELFGYEPGTFTGANIGGRVGKFEMADGGTVFLDEIGDLPYDLQPKLLRVLNDKKVIRLGGKAAKSIDFRLISCSNKSIKDLMDKKMFRGDLYYRIHGAEIILPPLSKRMEYFDDLIGVFFRKHGRDRKISLPQDSRDVMRKYDWPGNVRELEKTIQYLLAIKLEGPILPTDLPFNIRHATNIIKNMPLKEIVRLYENSIIKQALARNNNNITKTAKELKISRRHLHLKLKK